MTLAAANGRMETVQLLLEAGANRDHKQNNGKNAMDIAREDNHMAVVALLEEHIASKSRGAAES